MKLCYHPRQTKHTNGDTLVVQCPDCSARASALWGVEITMPPWPLGEPPQTRKPA